MNFAYVQFTDCSRLKEIVEVTDIKNFAPRSQKDYCKNKLYEVYWSPDRSSGIEGEPGYYPARILLLAETKTEIEARLQGGKRISVPKVLNSSPEDTKENDCRTRPESPMAHQKSAKMATAAAMRKVLSMKLQQKRNSPLFSDHGTSCSDSDDGAVVPEKVYQELVAKYRRAKESIKELNTKIDNLKTAGPSQFEDIISRLEQIEKKLDKSTSVLSAKQCTEPIPKKARLTTNGETVCINNVATIALTQWLTCQRQKKESLFVRNLTVAMWGKESLQQRSTQGKPANRGPAAGTQKPQLTPEKVAALEDCNEDWLRQHGASGDILVERMEHMNSHVISTIRDCNRVKKNLFDE
ncbi:uncharacterized protein ISCGN_008119 [Ixodes scapularis]